jgi:hypothetical protein
MAVLSIILSSHCFFSGDFSFDKFLNHQAGNKLPSPPQPRVQHKRQWQFWDFRGAKPKYRVVFSLFGKFRFATYRKNSRPGVPASTASCMPSIQVKILVINPTFLLSN